MTERIRRDEVAVTVTFSTDTSAYASGDLIADTQEIGVVAQGPNGLVTLESIHIVDKDDQKTVMYFVFLTASTSLGTENSAPTIADADATSIVGVVPVAAANYVDVGGASFGSVPPPVLPLKMQTSSAAGKLYVGIVNATGTPTYTAAGLVVTFIFSR